MTTSSTSETTRSLTRSEYVSTLPPWRRLLAMVNRRPVYDIEQETEQLRIESLESEKRLLENKKQLRESEKRLKLLQEGNARIARFEQELFSSSNQAPFTGDSSPTSPTNWHAHRKASRRAEQSAGAGPCGYERSPASLP